MCHQVNETLWGKGVRWQAGRGFAAEPRVTLRIGLTPMFLDEQAAF